MKKTKQLIKPLLLLFALIPGSELFSQGGGCSVDFPQDTISIQCGDTATLAPFGGSNQLGDDFNDQQLNPGWTSNQTVEYYSSLSCLVDPVNDGTPFAWMGPNATQPRNLTTGEMNVSCGGTLCFDMIMGMDDGSGEPCEGPDQSDEGIHLQYSTDNGNTWNDIFYFNPDTVCCGCPATGCGNNSNSPFIDWDNYCFSIPPAAQTDTTQFRWWQSAGSGQNFDHWGLDNVDIVGATCDSVQAWSYDSTNFDSISDTNVTPTTNTDYTVWGISDTAAASGGDTCSADVHVDVSGVPSLNVTATPGYIQCNDTAQLDAAHNTGGLITYEWSPNFNISDTTIQSPEAWPHLDTSYQVIAYSNGSPQCADTSSVSVDVNEDTCIAPEPTLYQPSCHGESDGRIVADILGCRGPFEVIWRDGSGSIIKQDSPVTGLDTLSGLTTGQYQISSIDTTGCQKDTTVMLGEPDSILASLGSDTIICQGGTAQLTSNATGGNGPPYSFNWNNGLSDTSEHAVSPNAATDYELTVEDSNGCVSPMVSLTVDVYPSLYVSTEPDDTICPGGTAQLTTASTSGGSGTGYSYTWTNGAGDTVGTGQTTSVQPSTTMEYIVHLEDDCESSTATDTMTVHIYQGYAGSPVNMAVSDTAGCYPVTVDLTCLVPSNKVASTFWSFGDGTTSNDSGITQHTYTEPGCYDVTLEVTSTNGCIEDSTFEDVVCARPYPTADFQISPEKGTVLDPELMLVDRSSDAVAYEWNFEHVDSTSTLPTLEMEFPDEEPGNYEVEQWVVNQYGCADSITKTAIIEGVFQLYIPNAFTPDGDGKNDVFRPQGEGISEDGYRLRIYNRWGELLFQSKDPYQGWDGTANGDDAQPGVYVWEVTAKDIYTGNQHQKSGHVTLIR